MEIEESNSEVTLFHSIRIHKAKVALLEEFKELSAESKINKRNKLIDRMILRLLIKKIVPAGTNRPLHLIISEIVDEFMLDELEFALWTIYLERISWKREKCCNNDILNFAAFKVKSELGNAEPFFANLSQKYPNFKLKYQKWTQKNKKIFDTSMADINNKFRELTNLANLDKELSSINFAFFSEYIMRSSDFNCKNEAKSNENRSNFDFQSNSTKKYIKINDEIEEWADIIAFGRSSSTERSTSSSEDNDSELVYQNSPSSYLDWEDSILKGSF